MKCKDIGSTGEEVKVRNDSLSIKDGYVHGIGPILVLLQIVSLEFSEVKSERRNDFKNEWCTWIQSMDTINEVYSLK